MRSGMLLTALVTSLAVAGTGAAATGSVHERSLGAPGRVLTLALTGRHVAFAVDATRKQCPQVQLWLVESDTRVRFPWRLRGCKEGPSTGFGVQSVAVANTRIVWLSYIGGNLRDWQLWTATPTRRSARQLRFVERDVDAVAPIVLGPGTPEGVPYAVDRELVYLDETGQAIFRVTLPAPARALAARARGHSGVAVAVLLANGRILGLDRSGRELVSREVGPTITAIGLDDRFGIAVQDRNIVRFPGRSVTLPAGALMVDVDRGRVLWTRAGDLGMTSFTGATRRLVDGTRRRPAYGQIDAVGTAWARSHTVHWTRRALSS
jgi:hypothetical protein